MKPHITIRAGMVVYTFMRGSVEYNFYSPSIRALSRDLQSGYVYMRLSLAMPEEFK